MMVRLFAMTWVWEGKAVVYSQGRERKIGSELTD